MRFKQKDYKNIISKYVQQELQIANSLGSCAILQSSFNLTVGMPTLILFKPTNPILPNRTKCWITLLVPKMPY